ncbi:MAG: hypothetical protein J6Q85_00300 [Clostridia bacterium]|nr:hypothetical protein [Clostridia bacterium]
MKISSISIKNEGYIYCKSGFYSVHDSLSNCSCYCFSQGVNKLIGEIDSGSFAISYLLSMYKHRPEDFVLFDEPKAAINNKWIHLNDLSEFSCYMDQSYPLFSTTDSVKECVMRGLNYSGLDYSHEDVRNLFHIDSERFERPITGAGNEIFKVMAAIGFSFKKEIFCFPWLSNKRFESYHHNLTDLLEILEKQGKIIVLPVGLSHCKT